MHVPRQIPQIRVIRTKINVARHNVLHLQPQLQSHFFSFFSIILYNKDKMNLVINLFLYCLTAFLSLQFRFQYTSCIQDFYKQNSVLYSFLFISCILYFVRLVNLFYV